jgi:hypothetical protein
MKAILVSIGLCLVATAVHSTPASGLIANERPRVVPIVAQCVDRCESSRAYFRYRHARAGYSGRYVLVRDPLLQRRPLCLFGSYVACVNSGAFCTDLCH